jgi:hypothetical protein
MPTHSEMKEIIEKEAAINGIVINRWKKSSSGGAAYNFIHGNFKIIEIPIPNNYYCFGICHHEIGHLVLGHCVADRKKLNYVIEYEAEKYAIAKLKEYHSDYKQYELQAALYVLKILYRYQKRGHDMKKVPMEILLWTGLKGNKWHIRK